MAKDIQRKSHVERKQSRGEMAKAVDLGQPTVTVASMFGVSEATVRAACNENNVRIPKRIPQPGESVCITLVCDNCRRPWIFPPFYGQTKCEVCRSIENVRQKIRTQIQENENQQAQLQEIEKVRQAWQGKAKEQTQSTGNRSAMGERKGPKPSALQSQSSNETRGRRVGNSDQLIA